LYVTNCLDETGCDAATRTNFNGRTCFFKRVEGSWTNSVPNTGAISFMRVKTRSQFMDLEPNFAANMGMPGNNISNLPSPSMNDCNSILWQASFAAATLTNYNEWRHMLVVVQGEYIRAVNGGNFAIRAKVRQSEPVLVMLQISSQGGGIRLIDNCNKRLH
jgi:hypothetical protein